uniref:Capsid protein n=1 Tax=Red panda feces-associated circular DNA virus 19 TaxID=2863972 RepID=A0A8K1HHY7_9VIRU|nr:capsid protein [Red panda feces-associated circular DNA virus 19]
MPPLKRKSTKFSRKAAKFRKANSGARRGVRRTPKYGNFIPGYDRVGGLYKLHGLTRRGGELKYCDKSWSLDSENKGLNRDDAAQIQWTNAAGAVSPDTMVSNTWYIAQSLVTLKQGQGPSDRIGRKTTLKSITSKMGISITTNTHGPLDYWCRVLYILDKQCNGGIVEAADVFEPVTKGQDALVEGGNLILATLPNMGNSQRFVTLRDDVFKITKNFMKQDGQVAADQPFVYSGTYSAFREVWIPCNHEIEQVGPGAQISGIKSNNIICLVSVCGMPITQADAGTESMDNIKIWGNVRSRYDDN